MIFSLERLKRELRIWPRAAFASRLEVCDLLGHHLLKKKTLTSQVCLNYDKIAFCLNSGENLWLLIFQKILSQLTSFSIQMKI